MLSEVAVRVSAVDRALLAIKAAGRRVGVELLRFNPTNSLDAAWPLVLRDQGVDPGAVGGPDPG